MDNSSDPRPLPPESARRKNASGRTKLIEQLFLDHNRSLITFLVTRLYSEAQARVVAQEAYVRLLQLEHTDAIGFHLAYLFRMRRTSPWVASADIQAVRAGSVDRSLH